MVVDLIDSKIAAAIDKYTIEELKVPSLILMEEAARFSYEQIVSAFKKDARILVVCGGGNNGADGLAMARMLILTGFRNTDIILLGNKFSEQNKTQQELLKRLNPCYKTIDDIDFNNNYDLIVDAIFGVGLSRYIEGIYKTVIEKINLIHEKHKILVYALDVPSGVDASTGRILGIAIKADKTFTFGFEKIGLRCGNGYLYAGEIKRTPIGLNDKERLHEISMHNPDSTYNIFKQIGTVIGIGGNMLQDKENKDLVDVLDKRKVGGNKGSYGKVSIIAGSKNIGGAAILSSITAYRMGVGMVKVLTHKNNRDAILNAIPECLIETYENDIDDFRIKETLQFGDICILGPGLSTDSVAIKITEYVLDNRSDKPLIIDADAINIIAANNLTDKLIRASNKGNYPIIITPHLKEMERLSGIDLLEIKSDSVNITQKMAKKLHVICCLKDAKTVVSDGNNTYINLAGNDGMGTAGSGDVLTGVFAGVLSYGFKDMLRASILAINLHACAGDLAAEYVSKEYMVATDMAKFIDKAIKTR